MPINGCLHDEIVDLETRFPVSAGRYGRTREDQQRITALLENSLKQEKRIFRDLPFSPEDMRQMLNRAAIESAIPDL